MKRIEKYAKAALALTITGVMAGCGTARLVRSAPGKGGEVALVGLRDKARENADGVMLQVCGSKKPEVVEEGEAVVGTTTHDDGQSSIDPWRKNSTRTSNYSESTQKTEWRIKFECR